MTQPPYLNVTPAAALAGVTTSTLRQRAIAGQIRHRSVPGPGNRIEIHAGDLARWMRERPDRDRFVSPLSCHYGRTRKRTGQEDPARLRDAVQAIAINQGMKFKSQPPPPTQTIAEVARDILEELQ